MKINITRMVEIDAEAENCGRCDWREENYCSAFGEMLVTPRPPNRKHPRLAECKAAEVRKP